MMITVARPRLNTPVAFLAEQEQLQLQWPNTFADRRKWQRAARIVKNKMSVASRFTSERLAALNEDSELYFELCEAKRIAMEAHGRALKIWLLGPLMSENSFRYQAETLHAQCDTLKGSIKQIFALLDEDDLASRIDRAM